MNVTSKHLITFARVSLSLVTVFREEAKETFKYSIRITAPLTTRKKKAGCSVICSPHSQARWFLPPQSKDYRSLTFCDSSETSVSQSVRPLKWIRPNINWSAPYFQTSACGFECCQSCDYHSVVPSLTLRNDACLFPLAGHEATGSLRCDHEQHPVILSTHQTGPCHTRQRWGELPGGAAYLWWKGAPRSLVWSTSALRGSRFRISWSYETANDTACTACFLDVKWLAPKCAEQVTWVGINSQHFNSEKMFSKSP